MLPLLINVPRNEEEWQRWSFAHKDSHQRIRQAIQSRTGINLVEYVLDPIPSTDVQGWLQRNQQTHNDMNNILQTQSSDLQEVDFEDESQKSSWIYLHWQEHQTAEQKLGI